MRGNFASGSIGYRADMIDPDDGRLELFYNYREGGVNTVAKQHVHLVSTTPNFGGRRWWMICPERHARVGKLYLPVNGDRFASRLAWHLGYRSQRVQPSDKALERLFAAQMKLGCAHGLDKSIKRPKGMWQKTFEVHQARYDVLERAVLCDAMKLFPIAASGSGLEPRGVLGFQSLPHGPTARCEMASIRGEADCQIMN
jgi:hypothetical protein